MYSFQCPICDHSDWKNVDEFRLRPVGMAMCTHCGFVTYPDICLKEQDLTKYYQHDYRTAPAVDNLYAGERKLHYHGAFLEDLFRQWKTEKFEAPRILEIGAAFGMVLSWIRTIFPKAELYGTELTLSFRRNAYWLFSLFLSEKPDYSKKYDLIISYKVAEHIPQIDKELRKSVEALSDKGVLYISVPTWFNEMVNFGKSGFDLEYYYDTNHVNVWSKNLFEQLLKKVGLEIVKENHATYGNTYLCKRNDALMSEPRTYDNPEETLQNLKKVIDAGKAAMEGRFEEAIAIWPNFPEAHVNFYETRRSKVHQGGFLEIMKNFVEPATKACPNSAQITNFAADLCMRYEQFEPALEYLKKTLDIKANDPSALIAMGHCFRHMAAKCGTEDQLKLIHEARQVMQYIEKTSQQCKPDAITWLMQDNARVPMPNE